MFGDDPSRPSLRVCCGPRCGASPGHRAIYEAAERGAGSAADVLPTMCQGLCHGGVTLVLPGAQKVKARDAREAEALAAEAARRAAAKL